MTKILLFTLLAITSIVLQAKNKSTINGIVFNDVNKNGFFDKDDAPLQGISVSSLEQITQTNKDGAFTLPIETKDIVFVIKPNNFEFILKENRVPDFYRICYQHSSPDSFKYAGITEAKLPEMLYFPLYAVEEQASYKAQIVGDIQAPSNKEVEFFQEFLVPELHRHSADFKVFLGDIADNNLNIYSSITSALKGIDSPNYMVFGNHDVNYKAISIEDEAETFRSNFGPDYYSFNYGNNHFVVLNTVLYNGWNSTENRKGSYTGGLHQKQLNWLKQDLASIPTNRQIVLMAHIPILTHFSDSLKVNAVFEVLKPFEKIVAIYGHLHTTGSWDHDPSFLWEGQGKFEGQIAGAACGAWWMGPYSLDSIPDATCTDGSPSGFYNYEFNTENYSKKFIPAGKNPDFQLRVSLPAATIASDSLNTAFIYINVFDGNTKTTVNFKIDNGGWQSLEKVIEVDPFMQRNDYLRFNRENWKPGLVQCSHLWKAPYPNNLSAGKHTLFAETILEDGTSYSAVKVFEITE